MPGETAVLVVTTLVCFFISHARLRVRLHPRHSLRPLFFEEQNDMQDSGANMPRECEAVSGA